MEEDTEEDTRGRGRCRLAFWCLGLPVAAVAVCLALVGACGPRSLLFGGVRVPFWLGVIEGSGDVAAPRRPLVRWRVGVGAILTGLGANVVGFREIHRRRLTP